MTVVLDSWAILRYIEDIEPAAQAVADLLNEDPPMMSWINLGEVFYVIRRLHGDAAAVTTTRDIREVVDCVLPNEEIVVDAARIKAGHPLAYADAFAAATAIANEATLWTGDPELLIEAAPWRWRDLRTG